MFLKIGVVKKQYTKNLSKDIAIDVKFQKFVSKLTT